MTNGTNADALPKIARCPYCRAAGRSDGGTYQGDGYRACSVCGARGPSRGYVGEDTDPDWNAVARLAKRGAKGSGWTPPDRVKLVAAITRCEDAWWSRMDGVDDALTYKERQGRWDAARAHILALVYGDDAKGGAE